MRRRVAVAIVRKQGNRKQLEISKYRIARFVLGDFGGPGGASPLLSYPLLLLLYQGALLIPLLLASVLNSYRPQPQHIRRPPLAH